MGHKAIFNSEDIRRLARSTSANLHQAFQSLSDQEALDAPTRELLKKRFTLDVPALVPEGAQLEEKGSEVVVHVPFSGNSSLMNLYPWSWNQAIKLVKVENNEVLIDLPSSLGDADPGEYIKAEIENIEIRLRSIRAFTHYLNQVIEAAMNDCLEERKEVIAEKKRSLERLTLAFPNRVSPVTSLEAESQRTGEKQTWDIFMSHASPDKPWVRGLVKALRESGVTVWFDESTLEWGEDLQQGINRGLMSCSKAIAVLSQSYLAQRKWTEAEISGLLAREKLGESLILPIWHEITEDDLKKYNLILASRLAKVSESANYDEIVRAVLKVLNKKTPTDDVDKPNSAVDAINGDKRELVAYAWYEQKGPDAKKAKVFIRKSDFMRGQFVMIDEDQEAHGTEQEIATKFFMSDRWHDSQGYTRMQFSNPSNLKAFNL